ncbi:MAG TPA: acyclic terpene utilization AtuA family protein [Kofleriaceae bacterium]|jgi:hypothetical protein|nr:acyclic terpene utilization AtuA family protein [Kofleriaceae bacterium]
MTRAIRIGCGSGFWGDTALGAAQLVERGDIDVLALDYLAEITMSILARMRARRPDAGYATDFVDAVIAPLAPQLAARRIKVVANAGGVHPAACQARVAQVLAERGVALEVATVTGDDVLGRLDELRAAGALDLETGRPLPAHALSANAYLGAFPIAEALRRGADIVITGRCVDSALVLGPLIAAYGWTPGDLDRLAQGSLAGHVIECGVQATGGLSTDWRRVERGYAEMGFPIVECEPDGSFTVTKPGGTGGWVAPETVGEQIAYEVHDPARYVLPDVVCDFTQVQLAEVGPDRVRVTGARGLPPPADYKASITYADGHRLQATLLIVGHDARAKAERVGAAILERVERINQGRGLGRFRATSVEALGAERYLGAASRAQGTREVVLAIGAAHDDEAALATLAREIAPAATSMVQSITGFAGGRPSVQPVVRLASCLVPRAWVAPVVELRGERVELPAADPAIPPPAPALAPQREREPEPTTQPAGAPGPTRTVPLRWLARGRSGDKGNTANIGILARSPELVPVLHAQLTAERVQQFLAHLVHGEVRRHDWPGLAGWNFVCTDALGGGGIASLRFDPQGKALAQILLEMPIEVPESLAVADPEAG